MKDNPKGGEQMLSPRPQEEQVQLLEQHLCPKKGSRGKKGFLESLGALHECTVTEGPLPWRQKGCLSLQAQGRLILKRRILARGEDWHLSCLPHLLRWQASPSAPVPGWPGERIGERWQSKSEKRTSHEASSTYSMVVARMDRFLHGPWAGWRHLESSPLADKAPRFLRECMYGAGGYGGDRGREMMLVVGAMWGWGRLNKGLFSHLQELCRPCKVSQKSQSRATFASCHTVDAETLSVLDLETKKTTQRGFIWSLLTAQTHRVKFGGGKGEGAERQTASHPYWMSLEP